jgi:hypothetical protein
VTFTIEFSGTTAEMHICLPYSMVEPIRDVLYSTMHSEHLVGQALDGNPDAPAAEPPKSNWCQAGAPRSPSATSST